MDKSLVKCNNKVNKLSKYQPKNDWWKIVLFNERHNELISSDKLQ
jgi:hypothetical protein